MAATDLRQKGVERLLTNATHAEHGARDRLATAVVDLFLPDGRRLSEFQRIGMTALLAKLIAAIEDELRQHLIEALAGRGGPAVEAGLAAARVAIAAPVLDRAGLLRDTELVATLLRRADEHRLVSALRLWSTRAAEHEPDMDLALLDRLLSHEDPAIAQAAMTLLIAESRRFDRFQDPVLARTDLSAELQHRMVWRVAAALRDYLVVRHGLGDALVDQVLVMAATSALDAYDEGETLEGRAMQLASRLDVRGLLTDQLIAQALAEGRVTLAVAGLGIRAGIDFPSAWDMATDEDGSRLVVLLRAIDMDRNAAALFALRLSESDGQDDEGVAARIEAFDALDGDAAREAIRPWRLDGGYRRALAELASGLATGGIAT